MSDVVQGLGQDGVRTRTARWWLLVGSVAAASAVLPALDIAHVRLVGRPLAGWDAAERAAVRDHLLLDLAAWWALFAVAAAALSRAPRRAAVGVALAAGTALAVASLARFPVLSDDLYRYAWDGRVQAAGIDPYRFAPDDLRLARLRDPWLWPSAKECAALDRPPGCTRLNRPGVHTIYPPAAQLWFRLEYAVLPAGSRERGYQLLGLAIAAATAALLLVVLHRTGGDPRRVALWILCPVVPLEAVQNAHVDALAALLVLAALALAARRELGTAAAIALAGLTKLYPLLLLPGAVARRRALGWAAAGALVALAYLPYVLDVGGGVGGYLRGYLGEEGYDSGARFALLRVVGITGLPATGVAVLAVLFVVVLAMLRRLGPPAQAATAVFVVVLVIATPGKPWYELVLVVLVAVTGAWQWLGLIAADYAAYVTALLGGPYVGVTAAAYGMALALGLGVSIAALRRSAPRRQTPVAGR